jgi:hypothetical protein
MEFCSFLLLLALSSVSGQSASMTRHDHHDERYCLSENHTCFDIIKGKPGQPPTYSWGEVEIDVDIALFSITGERELHPDKYKKFHDWHFAFHPEHTQTNVTIKLLRKGQKDTDRMTVVEMDLDGHPTVSFWSRRSGVWGRVILDNDKGFFTNVVHTDDKQVDFTTTAEYSEYMSLETQELGIEMTFSSWEQGKLHNYTISSKEQYRLFDRKIKPASSAIDRTTTIVLSAVIGVLVVLAICGLVAYLTIRHKRNTLLTTTTASNSGSTTFVSEVEKTIADK